MTDEETKNNQDEIKLDSDKQKSKTVWIQRTGPNDETLNIKISKKSIDEEFVGEVDNLHKASNTVTSVINILEQQIVDLNKKFEKEQKRTRRKEWINRGRNRRGKYY